MADKLSLAAVTLEIEERSSSSQNSPYLRYFTVSLPGLPVSGTYAWADLKQGRVELRKDTNTRHAILPHVNAMYLKQQITRLREILE